MSERLFQLKYKIPSPPDFFETFCEHLKESRLPKWDETDPWTKTVLKGILTRMAEEFGFDPWAEYLRLDQVWPLIVDRQVNTIAVAIEHEVSDQDWRNVMTEEGSKLLDVKSHLKVLIFYPEPDPLDAFDRFVNEYADKVKLQELRLAEEKYLAIAICADSRNKLLVIKGSVISPDGAISPLSDGKIPYMQF